MSETDTYELRVQGHLDSRWSTWFDGMTLVLSDDGSTIIHGQVADQAALHGLIQKVRDLGLPLLSVTCSHLDPTRPDHTRSDQTQTGPTS
jgi:hypothetical protein